MALAACVAATRREWLEAALRACPAMTPLQARRLEQDAFQATLAAHPVYACETLEVLAPASIRAARHMQAYMSHMEEVVAAITHGGLDPTTDCVLVTTEGMLATSPHMDWVRRKQAETEEQAAFVAVKSVSSALRCPDCKSTHVDYDLKQMRSSDEPMTAICDCLDCGKHFLRRG
jgi:DNA-directed RNA polymerase subunit M/transcription elongation factor TFIIS